MIVSAKKLTIANCIIIGALLLFLPAIILLDDIYAVIYLALAWIALWMLSTPCIIVFTVVACYRSVRLKEYKYIVINAIAIALAASFWIWLRCR